MRTIKFRGKSISFPENNNDQWVYGDLFHCESRMFIGNVNFYAVAEGLELENLKEVDPETIGQFTGLYDKNGNEIYEGDIIEQYTDSRIRQEPKLIEWWNGQFVFKAFNISQNIYEDRDFINFGWWAKDDNTIHQVEIISNIHDNPNLLQQ